MENSDVDNMNEEIIKKTVEVCFEMHFSACCHLMFYTSIPFRPIIGDSEVVWVNEES